MAIGITAQIRALLPDEREGATTIDAGLFGDVLPTYLTRFVGRKDECAELRAMLDEPGPVTVCGIGGAGKTRLTIEVARAIRSDKDVDRICWVPLATTASSAEVAPAIGNALGLGGSSGDYLGQIRAVLGAGRALLVLDNCEHVALGCRELFDRILPDCPQLSVLTTSRTTLGVAGERIYAIPPLRMTGAGHDPNATDATALFVDRAAGVAPPYALTDLNGPILADICRTLHGLPLAIELAASWIRVLSPRDLMASLTNAHAALGSNWAVVEERHRSIQVVLDSSWQWLGDADRSVIEALGVFVGGFTREAAEAVAGADLGTLSQLSQLALIQRLPDPYGGSRYQVHELVRSYALGRLERLDDIRERHLHYFLGLVDSLGIWENTPVEARWSNPIAADLANIDAALVCALDRTDAEQAQRLAVGLDHFWPFCVPSQEHRLSRLEAALALPGPPASEGAIRARAQALLIVGRRVVVTDPAASHARYREAAQLFRKVDDDAGVAACIRDRGNARMLQGDYQGCRRDCLDSLVRCRACGDQHGAAWCEESIGWAAVLSGDWAEAITRLTAASAGFAVSDAPFGACVCEIELAQAHQLHGEWIESVDACLRALNLQRTHHLMATWADLIEVVARLCVEQRRWTAAAQLYGAAAGWRGDYDQVSWFPSVARFSLSSRGRTRMGDPAWTESYEGGRRLDPDRANQITEDLLIDLRHQLEVGSAGLSRREIEVLRLVAAGLTDGEIAERLVLSPRTVHAHLRSIYQKLGVSSRTAAIYAAAGIVKQPGS
jgi:predicted ATPase/DNA-binding CsgD family transcriptional regulator